MSRAEGASLPWAAARSGACQSQVTPPACRGLIRLHIMAGTMAIDSPESGAQKARARALIIPREHGAWGLLLVPLLTGVVASFASSHQTWPLVLFTGTALFMFWLRTPVESLLGSGPITVENPRERNAALVAAIVLAVAAGACFIGLMWPGCSEFCSRLPFSFLSRHFPQTGRGRTPPFRFGP